MTDAAPATIRPAHAASGGGHLDLVRILLEGRAFFALIVIIVVFSLLSPNYFTVGNFLTMANHVAIYGLLSVGMLLVILNGGIDLSVGSVLALCGVVAGALMQGITLEWAGVILYPPVWAVVVITCALGAFVGAVNGVLIAYMKVPACRHPWYPLRRPRRRAPDDQRPHLQQSRRPRRARQRRLQLAELVGQPHIDGLFIGRSAWAPEGYIDILKRVVATL